ncbi:hypothetical protein DdX_05695 [Ditylenchus destructor]|uniref:Secreted protein n=1 Tax=Ditylenchus destructor TaxID=166010 RepID=A0AAD4R6V0_9BILA|nr:hypothetical protein DdX_05695 [Ditylenchus destructor]
MNPNFSAQLVFGLLLVMGYLRHPATVLFGRVTMNYPSKTIPADFQSQFFALCLSETQKTAAALKSPELFRCLSAATGPLLNGTLHALRRWN